MRFRREGGCADYLLFFYIQQIVEIRLAVRVIADQEFSTVDCIMVYGLFRVQNGNRKLCIIPIPTVLGVLGMLGLHIFPPLAVLGQQQHLIQIGGRLHFHITQFREHTFCIFRTAIFSRQILADIYRLRVHQNRGKRMVCVYQRFQICLCCLKVPRIILGVNNGHEPTVDFFDLIPSIPAALTGSGFRILRRLSCRRIGFLPPCHALLQRGHVRAVGFPRRLVPRLFAAEQCLDLCNKGFQCVQQLPGLAAVLSGEVLKQPAVLYHPHGEVGGDLVHGLLLRQRHPGFLRHCSIALHKRDSALLAQLLRPKAHGVVAIGAVFLRCKALHTVRHLMGRHKLKSIVRVGGDLDKIPAGNILAVGVSAQDFRHDLHTHAQILAQHAQK